MGPAKVFSKTNPPALADLETSNFANFAKEAHKKIIEQQTDELFAITCNALVKLQKNDNLGVVYKNIAGVDISIAAQCKSVTLDVNRFDEDAVAAVLQTFKETFKNSVSRTIPKHFQGMTGRLLVIAS